MTKTLHARITETRLTKTEAVIAEYFLANGPKICFMTLSEMVREIGVSDASIIRCCRTLGFEGFADMQHTLQEEIASLVQPDQSGMLAVLDKYEATAGKTGDAADILHSMVAQTQSTINATIDKNNEAGFTAVRDAIIAAKRKYIVGFRSCSAAAFHFSRLLRYLVTDVVELLQTDRIVFDRLLDMDKGDVVVIFSLPRYGKTEMSIKKMAKDRGATVVVVTDKAANDIAHGADTVLLLETEGISYFQSQIGSVFIVEYLLTLIARQRGGNLKERIQELSKYYANPVATRDEK